MHSLLLLPLLLSIAPQPSQVVTYFDTFLYQDYQISEVNCNLIDPDEGLYKIETKILNTGVSIINVDSLGFTAISPDLYITSSVRNDDDFILPGQSLDIYSYTYTDTDYQIWDSVYAYNNDLALKDPVVNQISASQYHDNLYKYGITLAPFEGDFTTQYYTKTIVTYEYEGQIYTANSQDEYIDTCFISDKALDTNLIKIKQINFIKGQDLSFITLFLQWFGIGFFIFGIIGHLAQLITLIAFIIYICTYNKRKQKKNSKTV